MKRLILFALLLFVGMDVYAQGSAPSPPQKWKSLGSADTTYMVTNGGLDTVLIYESGNRIYWDLRGTILSWRIPDSLNATVLTTSSNLQVGHNLTLKNQFVLDNGTANYTINTFTGDGLEIVSGALTNSLGASIEGSEVTNLTLTKSDFDTTGAMVALNYYLGTSASSDSAAKSKYYIDNNLFGYTVTGTPSASTVPVFDAGLNSWTFGSGGSGSGDNARIDQTLDTSSYVVGSTTYPGGFWDVSTYTMRGDTGLNIVKSGAHPGDTAIFRPDWVRIQRNDGTQSIRVFRDAANETMLRMEDSSVYTKMTTTNAEGWKWEAPMYLTSNLYFRGTAISADGMYSLRGGEDATPLYIDDSTSVKLQGVLTNKPVIIGSSSNWTLWSDTLKGTGATSQIMLIGRADIDTVNALRGKMRAGQYGLITSTDTALLMTRDTTTDTTHMVVYGALDISASAGRYYLGDSGNIVGKVWLESPAGTNGTLDSAQHVQADTSISKVAAKLLGSTSGSVTLKATATAGSTVYTIPTDGTSGQALTTNGAGVLSWSSAGGGGNGSADFDSTTSLDSNILKGAGGTILLDIHKSATPNVVIGKGTGMTSLIIGGNNSGITAVDTAMLVYNGLDFGNAYESAGYARLDSARVVRAIRLNRYYFKATDIFWSPEKYNAASDLFLTWNMCDTSATWPANAYKSELFHLVDSVGDSHSPLNLTWNATENDTLLSFNWKYASDSLAGTGSTDTSKIMYPNYALLYVNRTQVDSVFIGKTYSLTPTADSVNFTDRQIVPGDVVTVMLWFETQVTSTSAKRIRCESAYLNMRRY